MKFSDYLIKFRLDNNMTQTQFANKIGITQSLVSKFENNEPTSITSKTIHKIAIATGVSDLVIAEMYYASK